MAVEAETCSYLQYQ